MQQILVGILALIIAGLSPIVHAGDETEPLNNEIEIRVFDKGEPLVRGYFEKSITASVAVNVMAFVSRGWREISVGPTYYLTPDMSVGLNMGTASYQAFDETAKSAHRTTSAFWFWKSEVWEGELFVERYSRDPHSWYREGYLQKRIANGLSMGIFANTDSGWGPRIAYDVNKTIEVWVSPLVNRTGDVKAILGAKVSF